MAKGKRTMCGLMAILFAATAGAAEKTAAPDCHAGAYRLDNGSIVDVMPAQPGTLRWRRLNGRTGQLTWQDGSWRSTLGWTGRPNGTTVSFGGCGEGRIVFDGQPGRALQFDVTNTTFVSHGLTLRGRLVLPRGEGPVPIVVEVHGSENYSGVDRYHVQNMFPANGIGVFVYDKRGTGGSQGKYTQDFDVLSDDAVAAMAHAYQLAGRRVSRIGFHGGSQAGWVAPLAASKSAQAQFVAVNFGMAVTPLDEDSGQVELDLRKAGYGNDVVAASREITDAAAEVVTSHGQRGWERVEQAKAKYAREPWWPKIQGEFTGTIIHHTRQEIEAKAAELDQGTSWTYDPMPVLRNLGKPQLWVLAGADREAPPAETRRRLRKLANEGVDLTLAEFPNTDHGIYEFETQPNGERVETRAAEGYYRMQIDWIKTGRIRAGQTNAGQVMLGRWKSRPYGNAEILALSTRTR